MHGNALDVNSKETLGNRVRQRWRNESSRVKGGEDMKYTNSEKHSHLPAATGAHAEFHCEPVSGAQAHRQTHNGPHKWHAL